MKKDHKVCMKNDVVDQKKMKLKEAKKKLNKDIEEDLIAENQRLRMENEYLKKLNALVQERIKQENKIRVVMDIEE